MGTNNIRRTQSTAKKFTPSKGHITISYIQHVSEPISRIIRKAGVQVHVKPHNTICSKVVALKDKTDRSEKTRVAYIIKCQDCEAKYVGETKRRLRKKIQEHNHAPSSVRDHMRSEGHSFDSDKVKVLHQDGNWFR